VADGVDVLHTIGGDDTNTAAADLAAFLAKNSYPLTVVGTILSLPAPCPARAHTHAHRHTRSLNPKPVPFSPSSTSNPKP
jgi:hypothetical protein